MKTPPRFCWCVRRAASAALISAFVVPPLIAAPTIEEQVVAPMAERAQYVVSPQGTHFAAVAPKGSRFVVTVDGVSGPKFDAIAQPPVAFIDPRPYQASSDPNAHPQPAPVTFSQDGRRYAYVGRLGQEWVLMADNKEVLRIPVTGPGDAASTAADLRLEFSGASGRHLLFARGSYYGFELWVDGHKWPGYFASGGGGSAGTIDPLISPDGEHIAYTAQLDRDKRTVVIDGRDAGYYGEQLQFTADSKQLVCIATAPHGQSVLINGKPFHTARSIMQVYLPPAGRRIIVAVPQSSGSGAILLIDGKLVDATATPDLVFPKVIFSPDGKHYAAICGSAGRQFVVADGRKGQEYANVQANDLGTLAYGLTFSPDSSKLAYIASVSGAGQFVVINDDESDALESPWFRFSPDGRRVAYGGRIGQGQKTLLVVDGKPVPLSAGCTVDGFTFSPDSKHYAFKGARGGDRAVYLDGKSTGLAGDFLFSADGQHLALWGTRPSPDAANAGVLGQFQAPVAQGLFIDGQHVYGDYDHMGLRYCVFSPDSQHVFWLASEIATGERAGPGVYETIAFVDGEPAVHLDRIEGSPVSQTLYPGGNQNFIKPSSALSTDADGTLTLLGPRDGEVKRFVVRPGAGNGLAGLLTQPASPKKNTAGTAPAARSARTRTVADDSATPPAAQPAVITTTTPASDNGDSVAAAVDAAARKAKAETDAAAAKAKAFFDGLLKKKNK